MTLPIKQHVASRRLADARSWADGVTDGNRCALVVGVALNIRPSAANKTFRGEPKTNESVRNMPFTGKFFLKAQELADAIQERFGPPDVAFTGADMIAFARRSPGKTVIDGKSGVIFLENCWKTTREKLLGRPATGDHIDFWDGQCLEIYRKDGRDRVVRLMVNAERIRFWGFGG